MIGYNGNGRGNMLWHPDTGLFIYTSGGLIVLEDLTSGSQRHLAGHTEEISTLALQHDCHILASASGPHQLAQAQINIWDLQQGGALPRRTLQHHQFDVVSMQYSRDDRFLLTMGDYRECLLVVWDALTYNVLTSARTPVPMHDIKWDPYTVNEFITAGASGTILFWMLDETGSAGPTLNLHQADVPSDLLGKHHVGSHGAMEFTCVEYGADSTVYTATSTGAISAWDTRHNSCFMHWEADNSEIDVVIHRAGRLITAGTGCTVKLWSVVGVPELRQAGDQAVNTGAPPPGGGLTVEDEMTLDGAITAAAFDDTLDMGIVGTTAGTVWYINWNERTSIRLVSGHRDRVNGLAVINNDLLATCSEDGGVRVWSTTEREQTLQFQVLDQACTCLDVAPGNPSQTPGYKTQSVVKPPPVSTHTPLSASESTLPHLIAGYSDGTVRMFDLNKVEMVLKMHPHAVMVTAIIFSADGRMVLSGGKDGLVAVSSPTTGMTVRVITDLKGAPITSLDCAPLPAPCQPMGDVTSPQSPSLWLAASADTRVSVWSADWSNDFCELIDWLTFPTPAYTPDGDKIKPSNYDQLPPTLAQFSHEEPDTIVYTGYGMSKQIQFYSLAQKKVLRSISLTQWASALHQNLSRPLIAVANNERLLKLIDYYEGSFQDFVAHNNSVGLVRFSPAGDKVFTAAESELLAWQVNV